MNVAKELTGADAALMPDRTCAVPDSSPLFVLQIGDVSYLATAKPVPRDRQYRLTFSLERVSPMAYDVSELQRMLVSRDTLQAADDEKAPSLALVSKSSLNITWMNDNRGLLHQRVFRLTTDGTDICVDSLPFLQSLASAKFVAIPRNDNYRALTGIDADQVWVFPVTTIDGEVVICMTGLGTEQGQVGLSEQSMIGLIKEIIYEIFRRIDPSLLPQSELMVNEATGFEEKVKRGVALTARGLLLQLNYPKLSSLIGVLESSSPEIKSVLQQLEAATNEIERLIEQVNDSHGERSAAEVASPRAAPNLRVAAARAEPRIDPVYLYFYRSSVDFVEVVPPTHDAYIKNGSIETVASTARTGRPIRSSHGVLAVSTHDGVTSFVEVTDLTDSPPNQFRLYVGGEVTDLHKVGSYWLLRRGDRRTPLLFRIDAGNTILEVVPHWLRESDELLDVREVVTEDGMKPHYLISSKGGEVADAEHHLRLVVGDNEKQYDVPYVPSEALIKPPVIMHISDRVLILGSKTHYLYGDERNRDSDPNAYAMYGFSLESSLDSDRDEQRETFVPGEFYAEVGYNNGYLDEPDPPVELIETSVGLITSHHSRLRSQRYSDLNNIAFCQQSPALGTHMESLMLVETSKDCPPIRAGKLVGIDVGEFGFSALEDLSGICELQGWRDHSYAIIGNVLCIVAAEDVDYEETTCFKFKLFSLTPGSPATEITSGHVFVDNPQDQRSLFTKDGDVPVQPSDGVNGQSDRLIAVTPAPDGSAFYFNLQGVVFKLSVPSGTKESETQG